MISIEKLRVRAGLLNTDTSKDAELTASINAVVRLAEQYCNRKFMHSTDKEMFTHEAGKSLQLHRIPVINVLDTGTKIPTHLSKESGVLFLDGWNGEHEVEVFYEGGYTDATLPADLELAFLMMFDGVYSSFKGSGGGASVPAGGGAISSISIPDVGTIKYTGSTPAAASGASAASAIIPAGAMAVLDMYQIKEV